MFDWIYDYPPSAIAWMFAIACVAITWAGIIALGPIVRRWLHAKRPANELVGAALNSFAVLYGILVGLIAVEAYQNYSATSDQVSHEASSLSTLYRDVSGFPPAHRSDLQEKLRAYAREVVDVSWPQLRRGQRPRGESQRVTDFYNRLLAFVPADKREEILYAETLRELNSLLENRRMRLNNVDPGIPAILWWVVLIGGAFHLVLIWLFDMERHMHLILGGMLASYIGLVTAFIAVMDRPFRSEVGEGPAAIRDVLEALMKRE